MKGQQSIEGTDHHGSLVNLHMVSTFEVTKISTETVEGRGKEETVFPREYEKRAALQVPFR